MEILTNTIEAILFASGKSVPIADIAERMGMGQSRVTSILFRLRGRLQKFLEKEGVSI